MNLSSVPARQYVNTQTALDIYEANKEEFDQGTSLNDKEAELLEKEYNQVDGMESLYQFYLRQNQRMPTMGNVVGTEGFVESIKAGVKKVVEMIKSFFKWIWSFFGGSKAKTEKKVESVKEAIEKNGIKAGKHQYPGSVKKLFGTSESLTNNLTWVPKKIQHIETLITQTKAYKEKIKAYYVELSKMTGSKPNKKTLEAFWRNHPYGDLTTAFKGTGEYAPNKGQVHLIGALYGKPNSGGLDFQNLPSKKYSKEFEIKDSEEKAIQGYVTKAEELLKEAGALTEEVATLEDVYTKVFNNYASIQDPGDSNTDMDRSDVSRILKMANATTNRTLATIKKLNETIMGSINAIIDVTKVCTAGVEGEGDKEKK